MGAELLNARVLIVDDDRDTLEIMGIILDIHGAQTAVAATAAEGLRILRAVRPGFQAFLASLSILRRWLTA